MSNKAIMKFRPEFDALRRTLKNVNIYTILVKECNANPEDWMSFDHHFPECNEYRFIGNQGFGGKIWTPGTMDSSHPVVTCYAEDDNPERKAARDRANDRLKEL